jgi:Tol biopolymer transport system component
MRIRRAGWALLAGVVVAGVIAAGTGTASAATTTTLVSRNAAGQAGNGHSFFPSVTSDGRFVVFRSTSGNLVPGHGAVREVYLLDRDLGHGLEVVSVADDGSPSNGHSGTVTQASRGGLYVVFDSLGSNLVAGDTNNTFDVFVRMRFAGAPHTERESIATRGEQANGASFAQGISGDGRLVLFGSEATNLVAGDTNGVADLFVRDRAYQMTTRVNVSSTGGQANNYAADAKITPSGRYVVFRSAATNLVPGDTNDAEDVFVRDRFTGRTERVSVDGTGAQLPGGGTSPSISADGRYVTFTGHDSRGSLQVFMRDRTAGTTRQVSVSSRGEPANGMSLRGALSANGRYLAFESAATNLAPGLFGPQQQIYVRDLWAGTTTMASVTSAGTPGNSVSFFPSVTDTGAVAFQSLARNLLPPGTTSGTYQIFLRST